MHGGYAAQLSGLSTQAQPRQDHPLGININTQSSSIYAFGTRLPRWGVPDLGPPCAELPVSPDHSLPCATLLADVDIAVAGAIAQTISYPFEVVRQRVQVVGPMEPWQRCAAKFRRDNNDTANSQHKDDSQSNTHQLKHRYVASWTMVILWLPLPQLGNLHQENCVLRFNGARGYGRGLTLVIILDERRGCVECFQHMPMLTTTYAQGRRSDELGWAQSPGCLAVKVASKPSPSRLSNASAAPHCRAVPLPPSPPLSLSTLVMKTRTGSSPHLQEVPPTPHPSNPHHHHLACTQTRRYLYPSPPGVHRHRHPVTAPSQHGVQAPLQIPTTPTARKPPCDINSTWHTSPAMTQAANDGGHWRWQQYGDNNNAAMTATVTERLAPLHRHLIRRLIGNSVSVSGAIPTNTTSSPMAPLTTSGTSATRTSKGSSSCSSDAASAIRLAGSGAPVGFVTIVMGADGPIKVYGPSRFRISILSKSIFYRIFNLVSSCWWASWCYRYSLGARHRSLGARKLGRLVFLTKFRNIIRLRATMSATTATQDNNTGGVTTTTRRRL
ncbi:hypothetical protein H4582DRAFT_2064577 [Lactarius indigo]|nr:hypothetical protein H4582DRAFT_2064577 [Lactarius indigo]